MKIDPENYEYKKIRQHLIIDNKKILEIGSGEGRITEYLIEPSNKIFAIDIDNEKLEKAKEKLSKFKNLKLLIGSGEKIDVLKFNYNFFDIAVFSMSLHHLKNITVAPSKVYDVLKEHGYLLILEPFPDGEVYQVVSFYKNETKKIEKVIKNIKKSNFIKKNLKIIL
jgi:ubiquinone/menaquinone biosynthesis C-methylase UbiE